MTASTPANPPAASRPPRSPRRKSPAGGAGADGRAEAVFRDGTLLTRLPLAEQRSSYTELSDTSRTAARASYAEARRQPRSGPHAFGPAFRHTAATEG
ncbi:MAG: hypothetical protein ACLR3T_04800 [Alistipes finegoldii]